MQLRVAACQILTYPDPAKSANKVIEWLGRAAEDGVDVVIFPEACLCGYTSDPAYWEEAVAEDFLHAEQRVIAQASNLNLAMVLGTVFWENQKCYNGLLIVDKGGQVRGRYAKTHLAESEKWSVPGQWLPIYTLAGIKSCLLVCHDIRYPELVRLPAIAGAQICYFCSVESGLLYEYKLSAYQAMPIARAAENTIFLVMANAPADPDNMRSLSQSHGNSKIIHPDGNVLIEAGFFEECLVTATINIEDATRVFALRSANDPSIYKDWINQGVQLVNKKVFGE